MSIEIKQVSSLTRVFPDGEGKITEVSHGEAIKGERISYQIAYRCTGETKLKLSVKSPLGGCVTLRRVGLVPSVKTSYDDHDDYYERLEPGLFPDVLFPIEDGEVEVSDGDWHSVWIMTEIPADAQAGEYEITVCITADDETVYSTYTLEIIDAVLPPQKLIYTEWLHADCISDYFCEPIFNERYWSLLEEFIKTAVRTGVNMLLTPIFTPPLDTDIGGERTTVQLVDISVGENGYTFGFDKLRRFIRLAKDCGIRYFEMAHLFTQWGATATPKIMAGETKIFGWETSAVSREYSDFLQAFLPALIDVLHDEGIADRTYFHISDEPNACTLEGYKAAKNVAAKLLEGFPIIDALSEYEFYRDGTVKHPIPGTEKAEEFIENGCSHRWTYYCCAQQKDYLSNRFFAMPLERTRIIGVQLYLFGIEGFLHWGYNFYNTAGSKQHIDPYKVTDADSAFPSGDAFSVYPYNDSAIESLRAVVFYEALQDMRALELWETLAGREAVVSLIEKKFGKISFTEYPHGEEKMAEMRALVNDGIKMHVNK